MRINDMIRHCSTPKRNALQPLLLCLALAFGFSLPSTGRAQSTLMFNWPWAVGGVSYVATWPEAGLLLRVIPQPPLPHDNMVHVGAATPGHPSNGTPFIEWQKIRYEGQHVEIARSNLLPFGLVRVDLADPVAPSLTPIAITFNGFRADGSMVSQAFTVGGGGSTTFQRFNFSPDFAHSLLRVEIPSPAWAMDNLVWVPEPSTYALLGLGLLAVAWRRLHKRRRL